MEFPGCQVDNDFIIETRDQPNSIRTRCRMKDQVVIQDNTLGYLLMVEKYKPTQGCRGTCINCNAVCKFKVFDMQVATSEVYSRHKEDPVEVPCQCKTYPYCLNAKVALYKSQNDAVHCPNACWRCYKPCKFASYTDYERRKHAATVINEQMITCECIEYPNCEINEGVIKNYNLKEKECRRIIRRGGMNREEEEKQQAWN